MPDSLPDATGYSGEPEELLGATPQRSPVHVPEAIPQLSHATPEIGSGNESAKAERAEPTRRSASARTGWPLITDESAPVAPKELSDLTWESFNE